MIPKKCKRLAEVDFPIAVVSRHSAREKSIRHGHPSTLHLWWARRPLAACRAMLMALLLPDPADSACPAQFKEAARKILAKFPAAPSKWERKAKSDQGLREVLLAFIADFANWDVASNEDYLKTARALVKAAHGEEPPLVVDPFAGGGSIPLEALRIGCDAFASDLNPVACLILKTMLEDIQRGGPGLADELRKAGAEIKAAAEKELAQFYPDDEDGAKPIAYLWARTVRCESVGCGAEIPLVRSFWLSKKAHRKRALRHTVVRKKGQPPVVEFEVFTPKNDRDVPLGTVARAKATCIACGDVLAPDRVRAQLAAQRGGADVLFDRQGHRTGGARLLAVVTLREDKEGRQYRVGSDADHTAIRRAQQCLSEVATARLANGLSAIPDEPTPVGGGTGAGRAFSVQKYGMLQWGDLFTARQKLALLSFTDRLRERNTNSPTPELLALTLNHTIERFCSLCRWSPESYMETVLGVFGRQALPIVWDFAESVILSQSTGSFLHGLEVKTRAVAAYPSLAGRGTVQIADVRQSPLPSESAQVWFTDPPYYDAIPYADLSDFFFVWLRRELPAEPLLHVDISSRVGLTPKTAEIVQDETRKENGRPKDRLWFESEIARGFAEGHRTLSHDGVGCVVFAHKTTEGWEALLTGMIRGGWTITGSWPIATERPNRLRSRESAALATSVHLICRPRPDDSPVGDWTDIARELPKRVGDWMERLSREGIRGADLVFACIGPAMEVYSRYSSVEDSAGREIPLGGDPDARDPHERGFLAYVWEMVGRAALNQVLGTGEARPRDAGSALEEDARLTALFLWTLQATTSTNDDEPPEEGAGENPDDDEDDNAGRGRRKAGLSLVYDVVRRFAQPLGIHLDHWEGRIIETDKGVVRLLPVADRAEQLFGKSGAATVATRIEQDVRAGRQMMLDFLGGDEEGRRAPGPRRRGGAAFTEGDLDTTREVTTLDRVHAAMLLQSAGRANALRTFLAAEHERDPEFIRLANALSALYPKESEEKRLLDAMLLAMPK